MAYCTGLPRYTENLTGLPLPVFLVLICLLGEGWMTQIGQEAMFAETCTRPFRRRLRSVSCPCLSDGGKRLGNSPWITLKGL